MMVTIALMDMPMLQLLRGRLTQSDDLYVEMQFVAGKRMVKVESHIIAVDPFDTRIS